VSKDSVPAAGCACADEQQRRGCNKMPAQKSEVFPKFVSKNADNGLAVASVDAVL